MTNLTHDEIITYGLNHDDEKVRDLARRFQDYRDGARQFAFKKTLNIGYGRVVLKDTAPISDFVEPNGPNQSQYSDYE